MKIVHLIDYFQPQIGYQETFLAIEHKKLGYTVTVVTSNKYYPFVNYDDTYGKALGNRNCYSGSQIEYGIHTIRLPSFEIPGTPLIFLQRLKETLISLAPNVVLCHGMYSFTSFFVAELQSKIGYKLFYDTHASFFNTNFAKTFLKRFYRFLFKTFLLPKILKHSDRVFAIGEDEQKFICQEFLLSPSQVPIIRLGADSCLFSFSNNLRKKIRSKLRLKDSDIVLIFSGKISRNKDVHVIFEAVKYLEDENVKLLLVGGGDNEYISHLRKLLSQKQQIWIDFIPNSELPSYYSAADIAIWPGDSTISIVEALSNSLPVILPEWYGTSFLDESGGVVRFQRGNPQELLHVIKNLAYNKTLRNSMGVAARKFTKKYLSWRSIAKQTVDFMT